MECRHPLVWGSPPPQHSSSHRLPSSLRALAMCAHCPDNQLSWYPEGGSHQQGGPSDLKQSSFPSKTKGSTCSWAGNHVPQLCCEGEARVCPHLGQSHRPLRSRGLCMGDPQAEMTHGHWKMLSSLRFCKDGSNMPYYHPSLSPQVQIPGQSPLFHINQLMDTITG